MGRSLGLVLMLGWIPITVLLFRRLGPRRAVLIAVVGGNLIVPCLAFDIVEGNRLGFSQPAAIGLAVAVGVVLGARGRLLPIRVDWLDLPMLVYVAYPLSGLIASGPVAAWDVAEQMLRAGWAR